MSSKCITALQGLTFILYIFIKINHIPGPQLWSPASSNTTPDTTSSGNPHQRGWGEGGSDCHLRSVQHSSTNLTSSTWGIYGPRWSYKVYLWLYTWWWIHDTVWQMQVCSFYVLFNYWHYSSDYLAIGPLQLETVSPLSEKNYHMLDQAYLIPFY